MSLIHCEAIEAIQNTHRLYVGFMRACDIIRVTSVDFYNSSKALDDPNQGYQRPPERTRITKIGSHLIDSILHDSTELGGLFPTAVTLASRSKLNWSGGVLELDTTKPLQIIDGQHRISGLRYAIEEKGAEGLTDFPIAFVVIQTESKVTEMNQFMVINGTAKSVRTDLVNSILTVTAKEMGDVYIKEKDRWKVVVSQVIERLDKDNGSPWHQLIIMPDESAKTSRGKIVRATSFITSLKPVYDWLNKVHFQSKCYDTSSEAASMYEVVAPCWEALRETLTEAFDNPDQYVIQKTPGLFSVHKLLEGYLMSRIYEAHLPWTKESYLNLIEQSPELTDSAFWHKKDGKASEYGSMKGFEELFKILRDSIPPLARSVNA